MELSIIIVNWESDIQLTRCLSSIEQNSLDRSYEVHIIDNNSQSIDFGSIVSEFREVDEFNFYRSSNNIGAAVINEIQERIEGEYVLFLGPDVVILPQSLQKLCRHLDQNNSVGGVTAKLLNPDLSAQMYYYRFWNLPMVFFTQTIIGEQLDSRLLSNRMRKYYYGKEIDVGEATTLDQPPAACLLVRNELLGSDYIIDPKFEFYFNDVDVCKRIYDSGYRIDICPSAEVIHKKSSSFTKRQSVWSQYTMKADLVEYFRKHHQRQSYIIEAMIIADLLFRILVIPLHKIIIEKDIQQTKIAAKNNIKILREYLQERLQ
ncbi:glycosyltransferase [Halorubrum salinum]|uniref:glycosyltransferase n=1 Tax=Halorubrum salinum TaxID=767517 RepID=UPI0021134BCB|nr:glycosyltransferase [Halorubrum salinum]